MRKWLAVPPIVQGKSSSAYPAPQFPAPEVAVALVKGRSRATTLQRAAKRTIDVVGSLGLLFVLSPLFALISVVILFASGGPIIYRHNRVGCNGVVFELLKFRSMRN